MRVIPTRSMQAGLGALVAFDAAGTLDENVAEMEEAAAAVRAGSVARASRSAKIGDVGGGARASSSASWRASPSPRATVLEPSPPTWSPAWSVKGADVLTVLVGDGAGRVRRAVESIRAGPSDIEVEVHEGGQPHYPLLFAVE